MTVSVHVVSIAQYSPKLSAEFILVRGKQSEDVSKGKTFLVQKDYKRESPFLKKGIKYVSVQIYFRAARSFFFKKNITDKELGEAGA